MIEKGKVQSTDIINPVDYYNKFHSEDAFSIFLNMKSVQKNSPNTFAMVLNKGDERIQEVKYDGKNFIAVNGNKFGMKPDFEYTPFMILQKFKFKESFHSAKNFVMINLMNIMPNHIRVGTDYYLVMYKTDRYNIKRKVLKVWSKSTIVDDYGKDYLNLIPSYDDFTLVPDNKNYQAVIGNFYNLYSEFSHKEMPPEDFKGFEQFPWINKLMNHIFGEQVVLGYKYMKVLYDHPKQALPILSLLSTDRSTGKSTFINFNILLWGGNSVIIGPKDIGSSFNGSYANKNMILIEESHFDDRTSQEKLKSLATQQEISVNAKFISHYTLPFYGKIMITSNDEEKFNKIDQEEIRYWVRKINKIEGKANHNVVADMMKEIPAFLAYLSTLEDIDIKNLESRQVFTNESIQTDALNKVKSESKYGTQKDIEEILDNLGMNNPTQREVYFTPMDIKQRYFLNNSRIEINYIRKILKTYMKLDNIDTPSRYYPLCNDLADRCTGRYFIWENPHFSENKLIIKQNNDHFL